MQTHACIVGPTDMKRIFLIVGTPGVGKSSVSALFADSLNGTHIDVGKLVEKEGLSLGIDEERRTLIANEKQVSIRVRKIIEQCEVDVVVDGHFAMDLVAARDVHLAFVLRRNPDELWEVLKNRGFDEGKIAENVAAEILDVCLFDVLKTIAKKKVCEIDVSGKRINEVVDELSSIVDGRLLCRIGVVDWLTKLEYEGRLHDFLGLL